MNDVMRIILARVREVKQADTSVTDLSDAELIRVLFHNYRANALYAHGMRLTNAGLTMLKKCYQFYEVPLDGKSSIQDMLFLDRACATPYYWEKEKLVSFDQRFLVSLRFNEGSLEKLRLAYGVR